MKKICTVLLVILWIQGLIFAKSLSQSAISKLSPDLQALVAEIDPENATLTDMRFPRVQTVTNAERETLYPITIRSSNIESVKAAGIQTNSDYEGWSTARVTYERLIQLTELDAVSAVFQGETLYPLTDLAVGLSGADLVQDAYLNNVAYDGSGVIVLIVDTGIDWSLLDFRSTSNTSESRILRIWDQTLTVTGLEKTPEDRDVSNFSGLDYGVEYLQADINDEIDGAAAGFVRTADTSGHGTAIAGVAVGNGSELTNLKYKGMAPNADIVVVRAGTGESFSDNNVVNALNYAQKISTYYTKPVIVNMSLGKQSSAHDGTSTLEQAVDSFTSSGNGRIAVVAAGNSGNESIHLAGTVSASSYADITINVPSFTPTSGNLNDEFGFVVWWDSYADISATITPPNVSAYTRNVDKTGSTSTSDGTIRLYNEVASHHSNGDLSTYLNVIDSSANVGPATGNWVLRVTNNTLSDISYHGWLFNNTVGATLSGGGSTYTIASPGTATSAVTVGSFAGRWRYTDSGDATNSAGSPDESDDIAFFSSKGPTRTEAQKPDITAHGLAVISSLSGDASPQAKAVVVTGKYVAEQGTSISAGVVSGAVALLLDYNGNLTAAETKSLLTANADTDSYTGTGGSVPNAEWGYGKMNIFQSLAKSINNSVTVNHDIYSYAQWRTTPASSSFSTDYELALRFTPTYTGDVTGAFFHVGSGTGTSGDISFQVWSEASGEPSSNQGTTVTIPVTEISPYSWNYVSIKDAGVTVTAGTNYYLVCLNTGTGTFSLQFENNHYLESWSYYRSSSSSSWSTIYNWYMRPVVSTNEETLDSSLPVELAFFNASTYRGQILLKWATESELENLGWRIERRNGPDSEWTLLGDHTTHAELNGQGSKSSRTDYSFVDRTAQKGVRYAYRLSDVPYSPAYKANAIILEDVELNIQDFVLHHNYPNPFNPSTRIAYEIPEVSDIQLTITDVTGREVVHWNKTAQVAGYHEQEWSGLDEQGRVVGAGVYFVTIQSGNLSHNQKILLLK